MVVRILLLFLLIISPLFAVWYDPFGLFEASEEEIKEYAENLKKIDELSQKDVEKVLEKELNSQKEALEAANEKRKEKGLEPDPWKGKGVFDQESISYLFNTLNKEEQSGLLEELAKDKLSFEDRKKLIRALVKNGGGSEANLKNLQQALKTLSEKSQEEFLSLCLTTDKYDTFEKRFKFILNLNRAPNSYKDLFIQASKNQDQELCQKLQDSLDPKFFAVLPLVDWLNALNLKSFYDPTLQKILFNRDYYNEFNTFDQFELWVQPLGYYAEFNQKKAPEFSVYNIGLTLGGSYSFDHHTSLSLGLGYTYSNLRGKSELGTASAHSLYLGPSLNFLFTKGFLSCMVFGMASFYDLNRTTMLLSSNCVPPSLKSLNNYKKEGSIQNHSWSIGYRVEGEWEWDIGRQFYLSPIGAIDFLQVFESQGKETIDKDVFLDIDPLNVSFFRSKLGLKLAKEFYVSRLGFFIPSLSFGWAKFLPFNKEYHYKVSVEDESDEIISTCKERLKKKSSQKTYVKGWGQFFYGGAVAAALNRGITVALEYELYAKNNTPSTHSGSIRLSWSW